MHQRAPLATVEYIVIKAEIAQKPLKRSSPSKFPRKQLQTFEACLQKMLVDFSHTHLIERYGALFNGIYRSRTEESVLHMTRIAESMAEMHIRHDKFQQMVEREAEIERAKEWQVDEEEKKEQRPCTVNVNEGGTITLTAEDMAAVSKRAEKYRNSMLDVDLRRIKPNAFKPTLTVIENSIYEYHSPPQRRLSIPSPSQPSSSSTPCSSPRLSPIQFPPGAHGSLYASARSHPYISASQPLPSRIHIDMTAQQGETLERFSTQASTCPFPTPSPSTESSVGEQATPPLPSDHEKLLEKVSQLGKIYSQREGPDRFFWLHFDNIMKVHRQSIEVTGEEEDEEGGRVAQKLRPSRLLAVQSLAQIYDERKRCYSIAENIFQEEVPTKPRAEVMRERHKQDGDHFRQIMAIISVVFSISLRTTIGAVAASTSFGTATKVRRICRGIRPRASTRLSQ